MRDPKIEAATAQAKLRALAVATGLLTEEEAEKWIVVFPADLSKFAPEDIPHCENCGEMIPLEIGIHMAVPEETRAKLMLLLETDTGAVN